jgi:DNA-binding transcriptional ArsR family regulator
MTHTDLPVLPALRLEPNHPDVSRPVAIAALLADPVRAGIMALLRDGPVCVCELAAALEERQNNISNHLARLRDAGLVRATRPIGDARRAYYERDEAACAAAARELGMLLR